MPPSGPVLLSLLRACLSGRPAAFLPLKTGEVDGLVALAQRSWLAAQVVEGAGAAALPSASLKRLRVQMRHTAVRNVLQKGALTRLLEACDRHGIPVLLVKGLWLAHCVYRDPASRESGDVDLLFRPTDVARFTELARGLGYEAPVDIANVLSHAQSTNECVLRHGEAGLLLDVHWSLTNPTGEAPVDEDLLWARSEWADLDGLRCRTLNLEDHLLYLCFHAAAHHRFWAVGPRCLYDVAMVIRRPPRPVRWDELVQRAQVLGWSRPAWLMFALVDTQLGVAAPASVMKALHARTAEDSQVCELAMEAIFAAQDQESLYRHMARLLAPQPWRERLRFVRHVLFPSRVQLTNQFGVSPGVPTWRLHAKRWAAKLAGWTLELAALALGSRAQREELARTRRITAWLAGGKGA